MTGVPFLFSQQAIQSHNDVCFENLNDRSIRLDGSKERSRRCHDQTPPNAQEIQYCPIETFSSLDITRCDMFVRTFSGLHAQYLWPILTPSLLRPFSDMLPRSVASAFRDMLSLEPSLREIMHSAVGFQRRLVAARLEPFFGSIRTRLIYCKVLGGLHLAPKRTQTNPTNPFFLLGPASPER